MPPITVFIGSGNQSLLERKVLIYSLLKHSQRSLDIRVFDGTNNTVIMAGGSQTAPMSKELQRRNLTEFSLYRYLIPQLMSFTGKAIYLDSDMLCLTDIAELVELPLEDKDFLCTKAYKDGNGDLMWATSALLINCDRCRFDLPQIFSEIDRGLFSYTDFSQMGRSFLEVHPYLIGKLNGEWNVFDKHDAATNIIHYTDLRTQPWRFRSHPYGGIWFQYFEEARTAGHVTDEDIRYAIANGYARRDLLEGNNPSLKVQVKSWFSALR